MYPDILKIKKIKKLKKIDPLELDWLNWAETLDLIDAIGSENMRFVGGAVRDSLLGLPVQDVDVATPLTPDAIISRLKFAKIKAIPTGIEHGTVTAVIDQRHFEITTLRHDVKTHGRHADVAFTDNWQDDAKRRDFTINALYLDTEGNIYDYFEGREDLAKGHIRFIGDATKRIEEDALRILRFYRFMAHFGIASIEGEDQGLEATVQQAKRLTFLSAERIRDELKKLLLGQHCAQVLALMMENGVWRYILPNFEIEPLARLVAVEEGLGERDVFLRLLRIMPKKMTALREAAKTIRLSNAEGAHLLSLIHADPRVKPTMDDKTFGETTYRFGVDGVKNYAILNASEGDVEPLRELLEKIDNHIPPIFPIKGEDLMELGIKAGPEMGELLCVLEERWIESDFLISHDDLLEMVKTPRLH